MGTIAQKLEYLNTTKGLIKDTINLTGAGITNDTFRSYANKLKLGLINSLNDNGDTIYSNLEKVSGKGSNLSLTPTYEAPMRNREIYGNTLQNGTPTPSSPVPIQSVTGLQNVVVCGKNLLNYDNNTNLVKFYIDASGNKVMGGVDAYINEKIGVTPSGTYYLSFSTRTGGYVRICEYQSNGTFIRRQLIDTNTSFTVSNNCTYIFANIDKTDSQYFTNLMIEKNNQSTTYEPYKGNTYEVNLGKNLLNTKDGSYSYGTTNSWVVQNHEVKMSANDITYQGGNIKLTDGTTSRWADGVDNDIAPSGTYTLSVNKTGDITFGSDGLVAFYIKIYNDDGTTSSGSTLAIRNNQNEYTQTFTVDSGKHIGEVTLYSQYIQCQDVEFKIQLERGFQSTSYSPYFTPYELNKIGDYEDSIKKSTGKNLFDINVSNSNKGIDYSFNGSILYLNGTTSEAGQIVATSQHITLKAGTYNFSSTTNGTFTANSKSVAIYFKKVSDGTNIVNLNNTNSYVLSSSFTLTEDTETYIQIYTNGSGFVFNNFNIYIMLNEGTALPYEPYGKVWYITKNVGKVVLTGSISETYTYTYSSAHKTFYVQIPDIYTQDIQSNTMELCDKMSNLGINLWNDTAGTSYEFGFLVNNNYFHIRNSNYTTVNTFKTWLNTNNLTFVYPLATPTYEVITNTELIEDLESLYNAKSKNGTTNITITSEDLSMILNVSVIKGDA